MSQEQTLFSYFRSSCSYRVRIACTLKNVPHKLKSVNLIKDGGEQNSEAYRTLNPIGEVPFFQINEFQGLGQSMAILQYIEAAYPQPALFPADPFLRSKVLQLCELINASIQPLQNLRVLNYLRENFKAGDAEIAQWTRHWIERGLTAFEQTVRPHAGKYCLGDTLTAADVFLVPQAYACARFQVDLKKFSIIQRIYDHCRTMDAFVSTDPAHQPDTPSELRA